MDSVSTPAQQLPNAQPLPTAQQAFGPQPTVDQAFGPDPSAAAAAGGAAPQPQDNRPSLAAKMGDVASAVGEGAKTFGKGLLKENIREDKASLAEGARIGSRVAQGLMELPENFVASLLGNSGDAGLQAELNEVKWYLDHKQPVPEFLKGQIELTMKIHHAVFYASDALGKFTDKHLPPPQSTLGRYGEGIATFLAGMALPIPKVADADVAAGLESANPKFTGASDAEKTLAILRAKGYKIFPGDMEAHLATPKTKIGRALQRVSASRGYALSLDNIERAERDINEMFHRDQDLPLGESDLEEIRDKAAAPYDQVRNLKDMQADADQDLQREVQHLGDEVLDMRLSGFKTPFSEADYRQVADMRSDLNRPMFTGKHVDLLLKGFRRAAKDKLKPNASASDQYVGMLYKEASEILERYLGREAGRQGQGDLAAQLKDARRTIAQTWDVQGALEGGRVSPRRLAALRKLRRGKALDPTLDMIARGYEYTPRSFQPATKAGLTEGRQYMFSWALWGLLRGDPRLMTVYLAEHGARKLSESEMLQLSPEEITRAASEGVGEGVDAASKAMQQHIQEQRQQKSAMATLKALLGLQAEEGSASDGDDDRSGIINRSP